MRSYRNYVCFRNWWSSFLLDYFEFLRWIQIIFVGFVDDAIPAIFYRFNVVDLSVEQSYRIALSIKAYFHVLLINRIL